MAFPKTPKLVKPKFGGKPKSFSKPANPTANKEYGGLPPKHVSDATRDLDKSQGNVERGFLQNTSAKATAAGPGKKPPKTPGQFKPTRVPGNSDFGYIGSSTPAPMPTRKGRR